MSDDGMPMTWARLPRRRTSRGSALISRLFDALYGPAAVVYEPVTRLAFAGEWRRWQATALPFLPERGTIVELGAGTGDFARIATTPAWRWIGIERSPRMIALAKRRRRAGLEFILGSGRCLPLRSDSVDAVVATFPAPYLFDAATVAEMQRVTRERGRLVVVLSGVLEASGPWRRLLRLAMRPIWSNRRLDAREAPEIAGFAGSWRWIATANGAALVFDGVVTRGAGCSQPLVDVAGRAPAHRDRPRREATR